MMMRTRATSRVPFPYFLPSFFDHSFSIQSVPVGADAAFIATRQACRLVFARVFVERERFARGSDWTTILVEWSFGGRGCADQRALRRHIRLRSSHAQGAVRDCGDVWQRGGRTLYRA